MYFLLCAVTEISLLLSLWPAGELTKYSLNVWLQKGEIMSQLLSLDVSWKPLQPFRLETTGSPCAGPSATKGNCQNLKHNPGIQRPKVTQPRWPPRPRREAAASPGSRPAWAGNAAQRAAARRSLLDSQPGFIRDTARVRAGSSSKLVSSCQLYSCVGGGTET